MGSGEAFSEIQLLLRMLDEAYSTKTWHGPNLKGSLRGLTAMKRRVEAGPQETQHLGTCRPRCLLEVRCAPQIVG